MLWRGDVVIFLWDMNWKKKLIVFLCKSTLASKPFLLLLWKLSFMMCNVPYNPIM